MSWYDPPKPKQCVGCGKVLKDEKLTVCTECRTYRVVEALYDELERTTNKVASEGWDFVAVAASPVNSFLRGGPTYQLFFKRRQ